MRAYVRRYWTQQVHGALHTAEKIMLLIQLLSIPLVARVGLGHRRSGIYLYDVCVL